MNVLTEEVIASFKDAARKLTGAKPQGFQGQVTSDYLGGERLEGREGLGLVSPHGDARVE